MMLVQLVTNNSQKHGAGSVKRREWSPDEANPALGQASGNEHPNLFNKKTGHAAHYEEDDHLVPAKMHRVQVRRELGLRWFWLGERRCWCGVRCGAGCIVRCVRCSVRSVACESIDLLARRKPAPKIAHHANKTACDKIRKRQKSYERRDNKEHTTSFKSSCSMIRQAVTLGNLPALICKICKKNPPLERMRIRDFSKKV